MHKLGEGMSLSAVRPGLSPDGRTVCTSDSDGLYLWDAATSTRLHHLPAGCYYGAVFSPDGLVIASVGDAVRLWDVGAGLEIGRLHGGLRHFHFYLDGPMAYAPDGRFVAAAEILEGNTGVHLWGTATGRDVRVDGGQGRVTALAFSPDGRYFLTAGADRTVLVWDVARVTGEPEAPPPPTAAQVRTLVADLLGPDPLRAFQAFHRLGLSPGCVVAVLRERLHPVAPADAERLNRWLRQLDSASFRERERATQALRQLGDLAGPGLKRVLAGDPSPEVRRRGGLLMHELERARKGRRTDWAVRLLERLGTAEARHFLETLARGARGAHLTEDAAAALARLARQQRQPDARLGADPR